MSAGSGSPRLLVVGSGWRRPVEIGSYTCRLADALSGVVPTDVVLLRQPGVAVRHTGPSRGAQQIAGVDRHLSPVRVFEGVDWQWHRSLPGAPEFIRSRRPDVVVLQWWQGAVLHSYLRLADLARRQGARLVMEWHDLPGARDLRVPGVTGHVRRSMARLLSMVDGHVVHTPEARDLLREAHDLPENLVGGVSIVPHGPHQADLLAGAPGPDRRTSRSADAPFTVLLLGSIRPCNGLEELVDAFGRLPESLQERMRLRIVGETWGGGGVSAPLRAVTASPARDRISVVNRYVTEAEAQRQVADADAVVLPYRRSSSPRPLHMAMSAGLPIVLTTVGGLAEGASRYRGATFVPPADAGSLATALAELPARRGARYSDPRSWETTVDAYRDLLSRLGIGLIPAAAEPTVGRPRIPAQRNRRAGS